MMGRSAKRSEEGHMSLVTYHSAPGLGALPGPLVERLLLPSAPVTDPMAPQEGSQALCLSHDCSLHKTRDVTGDGA